MKDEQKETPKEVSTQEVFKWLKDNKFQVREGDPEDQEYNFYYDADMPRILNLFAQPLREEIERLKGENEHYKGLYNQGVEIINVLESKPVEAGEEKVSTYDELNTMYQELLSAYGAMNKINGELMAEIKDLEHSLPSTPTEQGKGKTKEEILNPCVFRSKNIYSETNGMVSEEDALECMQEYADQQDWPEEEEITAKIRQLFPNRNMKEDADDTTDLVQCLGFQLGIEWIQVWLKDWKGKDNEN